MLQRYIGRKFSEPINVRALSPRKVELHRRRAKRISSGGIERC